MPENTRERWRPVAGYERYEVSDQGRVRFAGARRFVPAHLSQHPLGALVVTLSDSAGRQHNLLLRRLVAAAFLPPPNQADRRPLVRHRNGNQADCRAANLSYDPRPPGARRVDAAIAAAIRSSSEPGVAVALRYGISPTTVTNIRANRTWQDPNYRPETHPRRYPQRARAAGRP